MDSDFPSVLFPCLYNTAPPDTGLGHCAGSWGSYDLVLPIGTLSFKAQRAAAAESWSHTEPVPVPLLSPKHALFCSSKPANPQDFSEHLQNFFTDHPFDAFSSMANVLGKSMHKRTPETLHLINMREATNFTEKLRFKKCTSARLGAYSRLLYDTLHSVPVELLGSLLHEELSQQSRDAAFCEANTGGALDFIPLETPSTQETPLTGCLVYCANGADKLCFQQVVLQPDAVVSSEVCSFLVKGRIQQISAGALCGHNCVAVRSMYHCGVWSVTSAQKPHLLQALSSAEALSCTSLSPHVVGEVLVAGERGAAHLWRLGHGLQHVRTEDSNLYFNSQSSWRWCEFSAHPRVMLYADRTGAELTDIRVQPSSSHTLFRISQAAECRSGERLLLCRYLSGVHPFHHLVCSQYSAYIMDERFPCVPMLKCDHMMETPPLFCQVLPGSAPPSGGTAKILLGSQRSQEVTLLQYSGGRAEACVSRGPVQVLLRPRDSLQHLPTQLPHRSEVSQDRLAHPATGLTAVHLKSSEHLCVLQLLQTGDLFYQILEKNRSDVNCTSRVAPESPEGVRPAPPSVCSQRDPPLTSDSLSVWRRWLQRLVRSHDAKAANPGHTMAKSRLVMPLSKSRDRCRRPQRRRTSLHSTPAGSIDDVVPLPEEVQPEEWIDDLSSRLSASWDNKEGWHAWWRERLGVNRAEKTHALRRRRRKEKEVKRASGLTLLARSYSFTSSISNHSDLSEMSDWAWSDTGEAGSLSEDPPTDARDKLRLTPEIPPQPLLETPSDERRALQPQTTSGLPKSYQSSRDVFSWSRSASQSLSNPASQSLSNPASQSLSNPASQSLSKPASQSLSDSAYQSFSNSASQSLSNPASQSLSNPASQSLSNPASQSLSNPASQSLSDSAYQSFSNSASQSSSNSASQSSLPFSRSASQSSLPKKKSRMGF